MSDPKLSRGYRNRNPGNIDYVPANRWQGQTGIEPAPAVGGRPRFAVFEAHEWGIRALAVLLITYQDKHGLRTVRGVVNRWAPPGENNTSAYAGVVARRIGVDVDDPLDLHSYAHLRPLVEAIITHELGGQPYADAVLDEGLRRAGVVKPVRSVKDAAATGTGRAAISVAATASAAATAAPLVSALGDLPQWTGVALIVAAAAVAVVVILTKRRQVAA